jgi:hypothetical protein
MTREKAQAMRSTTLSFAVATGFALLLALPARAQDSRQVAVRIVSVKASPAQGEPPALPAELAPWRDMLRSFSDTSAYAYQDKVTVRAPSGAAPRTVELPREHQAIVSATLRADGKIALRVEITRPMPAARRQREGERERVLVHEVTADDGASYLVRVGDCFAREQHLLLIVTTGTGALD